MLCQECSLKSECRDDCAAHKEYVKSKSNFRATSSSNDVCPSAIPEEAARLCQKCSLKNECRKPCDDVETYLKAKRNYKTTYTSKEVSLTAFAEGKSMVWDNANELFIGSKMLQPECYNLIPMVWELIDGLPLTSRQRQIIGLYRRGINMAAIGRQLCISRQAVNQALFGHPKEGGGIVRKIQKAIVHDEELRPYLSISGS